ncbi:MAG: hypothetical protein JO306_14770 [Gemmatimonadetes bacterium]|nr:hypothetical protein [Gemmatimonadota bacterium]
MNSRTLVRAAAGAALALVVSVPAHAQLGALRRAAARAAGNAAVSGATQQAQQQQAASRPASSALGGNVLELTPAVLDRFQQSLAAEDADRRAAAQRLAALKTPEQYQQCTLSWLMSPVGKALTDRVTTVASSGDQQAMVQLSNEMKASEEHACGPDPSERGRMQSNAQAHAAQAGLEAGQFTPAQYGIIKERIVPFCRAAATAPASGDVRLQGSGSGVFWVYTATEAAALRERCTALMQGIGNNS